MIGVIALSLRTILLLLSANMSAGFADFAYRVSEDYLDPFRAIFTGREVGETGFLDVSAMFAVIVYLLAAWGLRALIDYVQNKIDLSTYEQQEQLAEQKRKEERMAIESKLKQPVKSRPTQTPQTTARKR
jgi:uncharacterized protein YggT (Ycf19 family)